MSPEEQEAVAQEARDRAARFKVVEMGIEAERFITSPLGRYLIKRAEGEREQAVEALVQGNPADAETMRSLQNKVHVIDMVQQWLADAITEGHAMEQSLIEEDAHRGPPEPGAAP